MLTIFYNISEDKHSLPLVSDTIQAGFPSPAQDYIEDKINLNEYIIQHPSATFFVRTVGESMIHSFIPPKALLVVDRSLTPQSGNIIVGVINGEFTVKKLLKANNNITLLPANSKFDPISVTEEMDFKVWGVVSNIIINTKDIRNVSLGGLQ